jgi:hypothetical protein
MGEVYRARDTRLGRDVALKVLPSEFTADPDRVTRFEHEARALAALNHPNIAAIYGVEDWSHRLCPRRRRFCGAIRLDATRARRRVVVAARLRRIAT